MWCGFVWQSFLEGTNGKQILTPTDERAGRESRPLVSRSWAFPETDLDRFQRAVFEDPAMISEKDELGRTHLHDAASFGHFDMVSLLLMQGAEIDAKTKSGKTPLHWAVQMSHQEATETLLANAADVNAMDNRGKRPLHLAAHIGDGIIVQMLRKNLAEINSRDNFNDAPLKCAFRRSHWTIVNQLWLEGALSNV